MSLELYIEKTMYNASHSPSHADLGLLILGLCNGPPQCPSSLSLCQLILVIDTSVDVKARVQSAHSRDLCIFSGAKGLYGQNPGFLDWQNPASPLKKGGQSAQNGPKRLILTQNRGTPRKGPKKAQKPLFLVHPRGYPWM